MIATVRISEITNAEVVQQYAARVGGIISLCYCRRHNKVSGPFV